MRCDVLFARAGEEPVLVGRLHVAEGFSQRAIGLLGAGRLNADEGLLLPRCRSVHTFGMRFPIDVLFVDGGWVIRRICNGVEPWRMVGCRHGRDVVELRGGRALQIALAEGDRLIRVMR